MSEGNSLFNKTKQIFRASKGVVFTVIILAAIVFLFISALNGASVKADSSATATLEKALKRAAVQCYAIEGFYPPEPDYLVKNYGVIIDYNKYAVSYVSFTANIMPDIKVAMSGHDYTQFNAE